MGLSAIVPAIHLILVDGLDYMVGKVRFFLIVISNKSYISLEKRTVVRLFTMLG